jgi:hypothetical protein
MELEEHERQKRDNQKGDINSMMIEDRIWLVRDMVSICI